MYTIEYNQNKFTYCAGLEVLIINIRVQPNHENSLSKGLITIKHLHKDLLENG